MAPSATKYPSRDGGEDPFGPCQTSHQVEQGWEIPSEADESSAKMEAAPKMQATAQAFMPKKASKQPKPAPIHILNMDSTTDLPAIVASPGVKLYERNADRASAPTPIQPIGTGASLSSPIKRGFFTTDLAAGIEFQGTRYLAVDNVPVSELASLTIRTLLEELHFHDRTICMEVKPSGAEVVTCYFVFDDFRETDAAMEEIPMCSGNWDEPRFLYQQEFITVFGDNTEVLSKVGASLYEGQVTFTGTYEGRSATFKPEVVEADIIKYAGQFGEVRHFVQLDSELPKVVCRVEYFQLSAAKAAVATTENDGAHKIGALSIMAEEYAPPGYESPVRDVSPKSKVDLVQQRIHELEAITTPSHKRTTAGHLKLSPTGRTFFRVDKDGNEVQSGPYAHLPSLDQSSDLDNRVGSHVDGRNAVQLAAAGRNLSAPVPQTPSRQMMIGTHVTPRSGSWSHTMTRMNSGGPRRYNPDNPQNIDLDKISSGQDVRTTVMIRNIPNEATCHHIKLMLDRTSNGDYDFSYLRIDFKSNKNVGYAFINFSDPSHIIPFYKRYIGMPWIDMDLGIWMREYHFWKVAEASYATCQGIDGLIEKFRNSSIMDEGYAYKPKLWITNSETADPALRGTEKVFPGINNSTKARRSRDNAAAIGLFPPGSGNRGRDGRIHHSRYDRGTLAQQQEDSTYAATTPMTPGNPSIAWNQDWSQRGRPSGRMAPPPPYTPQANQYSPGFSPGFQHQVPGTAFNAVAFGQPNPFVGGYPASAPAYSGNFDGTMQSLANPNGVRWNAYGGMQPINNNGQHQSHANGRGRRNPKAHQAPVNALNGGPVMYPASAPPQFQGANARIARFAAGSHAANTTSNIGGPVAPPQHSQPAVNQADDNVSSFSYDTMYGGRGNGRRS